MKINPSENFHHRPHLTKMISVKEIEPEICPICNNAFRRSDIEEHVNACLDAPKNPPTSAASSKPKTPEYKTPEKPLNLEKLLTPIHEAKPSPQAKPAPAVKPMESSIIDLTSFSNNPTPTPAPADNPMLNSHFIDELLGNVKPEG